jgi:folate-binding protein YgfZ
MLAKYLDRYLFVEQVKVAARPDLHEIALHGPRAAEVLTAEGVRGEDEASTPRSLCSSATLLGHSITVWRDDVCGVPGYHFIVSADAAAEIWQHLLRAHGELYDVNKRLLRPVGWAAFNACRIEAGRPLFGIDFENAEPSVPGKKAVPEAAESAPESAEPSADDAKPRGVLPAETGLFDRAVSVTKGCYLGQEIVARMHARGQVARQLVGLRIEGDALPIAGQPVTDDTGNVVGVITSSTMSPVLSDAAIALATIKKPHFTAGTAVRVPAEGKVRAARVVAIPFLGGISA